MKINKVGMVIITENAIRVEGWLMEPEVDDPKDATHEQMLLEVVIPWAQKKMNAAILENLQRISRERKAAQNPTEN